MTLENILRKKVIFITGKGGVGKSTLSATIAIALMKQEKKVLVIDADPAHSMLDVFGITDKIYGNSGKFSDAANKITKVYERKNLDLLLLNPIEDRNQFKDAHRVMWLAELGKELGFYSNLGRMAEFFTLAHGLWKSFGVYDKFVIDNEPSAGTLDMIENIDGWINGLDNVEAYKPIFNLMLSSKLIDRELAREVKALIYDQNGAITKIYKRMLEGIKTIFRNEDYLEPIIVSSPEDAVIRETKRLKKELENRLGVANRYIIFNKVMQESGVSDMHRAKIKQFKDETDTDCYTVPYMNPKQVNLDNEHTAREVLETIGVSITKYD